MNRPVKIDSRFATAEETARILGVSSLRTQQLIKLFDTGKKEKPRRVLSATARRRISLAAKKRWAALRANHHRQTAK